MVYAVLATALSDLYEKMDITVARDCNKIKCNRLYVGMSNEIHVPV